MKTKIKGMAKGRMPQNVEPSHFASAEAPDGHEKLKRRGMAPLVSPASIPVGSWISGVVLGLSKSLNKDIKGKLIRFMHTRTGDEFLFPFTGSIDKAVGGETGLLELTGLEIHLKRLPDGVSSRWKKAMYLFDVLAPAPEPVKNGSAKKSNRGLAVR